MPQAESKTGAAQQRKGVVRVALDVPLLALFDYTTDVPVQIGTRVIVPFGRRKMVGMVVAVPDAPAVPPDTLKSVDEVLDDTPALPPDWLRLASFAAQYYQRPLGEVIMPALPAALRKVSAYQGKRSAGGPVKRMDKRARPTKDSMPTGIQPPALNAEQAAAVQAIAKLSGHKTVLLHGITGSGKTEVYLHAAQATLRRGRQVLFMVPEINLTPQLEQSLRARLAVAGEPADLAVMHSGLSDGERLLAWMRIQRGEARVLLGTRLSIFAPLPDLGLIIVDEEHDTSYKQQDGLRYSARDLAVWRGRDCDVPVVLGSATPSLESWNHAERGHYLRFSLSRRATDVELPAVRLVDTRRLAMQQGFSPQLIDAVADRLARKQQSLIFINRRGYAPVLNCASCGWVSQCPRCTAYTVLHRSAGRRNSLQCHHCGY
ncbi:MAG TPA: primosomal protein N', partial [Burkholderiaceae bacterium]|nr:primosomal protein N' [Burkholderiaceae bacterium]